MVNYLGMDEFTSSYLESAMWSSTENSDWTIPLLHLRAIDARSLRA
jgi:hypothetical protein